MQSAIGRGPLFERLGGVVLTGLLVISAFNVLVASARGQDTSGTATPSGQTGGSTTSSDGTSANTTTPVAAPTTPAPSDPPPVSYAALSEHKLDDASKKLKFHYSTKKNAAGTFDLVEGKAESKQLVIKWSSAKGTSTKRIKVSLKFIYGKNKVEITIPIPDNPPIEGDGNGQYTIPKAKLDEVAKSLVDKINNMKGGFDSDNPLTVDQPVEITVTPDDQGGANVVQPVKLPDKIQLTMKHVG